MSDTTELKLFRHTTAANGERHAKTWFLLLGLRGRTVFRVLFSKVDLDPIISTTSIRSSILHGGGQLTTPYDSPELAERIVMHRMSESVGCDVDDWIRSVDPEYDLLVFLMAVRCPENRLSIADFVGKLNSYGLLNENLRKNLNEMIHCIYVEEDP